MVWKITQYDLLATIAQFLLGQLWIIEDLFRQVTKVVCDMVPMPAARALHGAIVMH